jgi:phosphopantothenoylcysteine decarboxylase/phosphopantothenate--cysteine ligase
MTHWDPKPPPDSPLGDRAVSLDGDHLVGKRIALLVTGGIAAMKAPLLARALRRQGAEVTPFISDEGLRYCTADSLAWSCARAAVTRLTTESEHLSDGERFDAYLIAPATYNTINKIACGIADGVITATMASALGRLERGECAVLVCPTMHGSMHTKILTESLERLQRFGVQVVAPRDEYGKHNLPDPEPIVAAVCAATSASPLSGRAFLVTGGPVATALDDVRRLSSPFTGALGIEIARELALCGADPTLLLGSGSHPAPAWLNAQVVHSIEEYEAAVTRELSARPYEAAILSAAVADFAPTHVRTGKTSSADGPWQVELRPTRKVIDEVHRAHPRLEIVGFKYETGISHDALMRIARERAAEHGACVANRAEESPLGGEQVAWLVARGHEPRRLVGKPAIARAIRVHLEHQSATHRRAHS